MAMFISYREKLAKVQSAKKQAVYITDVFRKQIEYFKENGLKFPFDAEYELSEAEGIIAQFNEICRDETGNFRERHERRTMIAGFEEIFKDLNQKIGGLIREMHDSLEAQYYQK